MRNLLGNAIKFTPNNGKITISVSKKVDHVEISVKDTGVGINIDKIKDLFRVDKRVSTIGTDNEKGTGLGLVLCKELINKNGGTISVESVENNGSRFYFTLPQN